MENSSSLPDKSSMPFVPVCYNPHSHLINEKDIKGLEDVLTDVFKKMQGGTNDSKIESKDIKVKPIKSKSDKLKGFECNGQFYKVYIQDSTKTKKEVLVREFDIKTTHNKTKWIPKKDGLQFKISYRTDTGLEKFEKSNVLTHLFQSRTTLNFKPGESKLHSFIDKRLFTSPQHPFSDFSDFSIEDTFEDLKSNGKEEPFWNKVSEVNAKHAIKRIEIFSQMALACPKIKIKFKEDWKLSEKTLYQVGIGSEWKSPDNKNFKLQAAHASCFSSPLVTMSFDDYLEIDKNGVVLKDSLEKLLKKGEWGPDLKKCLLEIGVSTEVIKEIQLSTHLYALCCQACRKEDKGTNPKDLFKTITDLFSVTNYTKRVRGQFHELGIEIPGNVVDLKDWIRKDNFVTFLTDHNPADFKLPDLEKKVGEGLKQISVPLFSSLFFEDPITLSSLQSLCFATDLLPDFINNNVDCYSDSFREPTCKFLEEILKQHI